LGDQGASGVSASSGAQSSQSGHHPNRFARSVYELAQGRGTTTLRLLDFGVIATAWALAYLAGFSGTIPFTLGEWIPYLLIPITAQLVFNQIIGLYGPVWRYASVEEAVRVVTAVVLGTLVAALELAFVAGQRDITLPLLSSPPIAALLILLGCGGIRFQARLFALERQRYPKRNRMRTLIIGATDEGLGLALELGRRAYADGVIVGTSTASSSGAPSAASACSGRPTTSSRSASTSASTASSSPWVTRRASASARSSPAR
jgi:hypothetical protein